MDIFKEQQKGITKIKTLNFSYTWIIHNFRFNDKERGECLESPIFCMPGKDDCKWNLILYPKGQSEPYKDYISLYLELDEATNPTMNTSFIFSILNSKNEEKYTKELNYTFKKIIAYGSAGYVKQSILFDPKNDLLPDGILTILCKVTAGVETESFSQDTDKFKENIDKFTLSSEFEMLLQNKHMTHITLASDGKELQAHKIVLAARSPVFLAMMQADMQEKENSRIEFTDVSADVLNEMLRYLYTGNVKNINNSAYELVKLADKYDIKGLKLMCEKQFYSELTVNSAIKLFMLADRYNCDVLKPLVLKFIVAHAKDILKTVEFKRLEKDLPILIKEMLHAIA